MDLFPLTLAWSHTLTVTGQPHTFRLTQDGITLTHLHAHRVMHTHTESRSLTLLHIPGHTHTLHTGAYEDTVTHTEAGPWAH